MTQEIVFSDLPLIEKKKLINVALDDFLAHWNGEDPLKARERIRIIAGMITDSLRAKEGFHKAFDQVYCEISTWTKL